MDSSTPYVASLTSEPFLDYEMRITAQLMLDGLTDKEIIEKVFKENLYQYPTERSLKSRARVCLKRLHGLNSPELIEQIVERPVEISKQICLYAMMRQYRIVWEFMITVIGEKYQTRNYSYSRSDIDLFFVRLQEQSPVVAAWSEATVQKIKSILSKILVLNNYIDSNRATKLNPVLLDYQLLEYIRKNNDEACFSSFNYFE